MLDRWKHQSIAPSSCPGFYMNKPRMRMMVQRGLSRTTPT